MAAPDTCRRGHFYTARNTLIRATGRRECRRCNALREAARYRAAVMGLPMPSFRTPRRQGLAQQQGAR